MLHYSSYAKDIRKLFLVGEKKEKQKKKKPSLLPRPTSVKAFTGWGKISVLLFKIPDVFKMLNKQLPRYLDK